MGTEPGRRFLKQPAEILEPVIVARRFRLHLNIAAISQMC